MLCSKLLSYSQRTLLVSHLKYCLNFIKPQTSDTTKYHTRLFVFSNNLFLRGPRGLTRPDTCTPKFTALQRYSVFHYCNACDATFGYYLSFLQTTANRTRSRIKQNRALNNNAFDLKNNPRTQKYSTSKRANTPLLVLTFPATEVRK